MTDTMKSFQSPSAAATLPQITNAVILRPVVFVIDATTTSSSTQPAAATTTTTTGGNSDDGGGTADEPFDVQRSSLASTDYEKENIYESFLAALRGKISAGPVGAADEEISLAPSYASAASSGGPLNSPTRTAADGGGSDEDEELFDEGTAVAARQRRFLSLPFTRNLHVGRWKATSPRKRSSNTHDEFCTGDNDEEDDANISMMTNTRVLVQDMEDDPDLDSAAAVLPPAALNSYSRNNPPVHFMSQRARIVSVSSRHAFPPSKFPRGKLDFNNNNVSGGGVGRIGGTTTMMMLGEKPPPGSSMNSSSSGGSSNSAWVSSYEIQSEGILPSGWIEKHARALPSAIIVVTTLVLPPLGNDNDRQGQHPQYQQQQQQWIGHAVRTLENLRATLAEKRNTPFHLVCLLKEDSSGGVVVSKGQQHKIDSIREKICQECGLPQSQVYLMKVPYDLEPDEFESGILRSPYNANHTTNNSNNAKNSSMLPPSSSLSSSSNVNIDATILMNPLLRQLDRSLRDTSAMYYSRLAESQERKLLLWRNRFHTTNASFELNTLLAAMRCARYAIKVGTLRELQLRTGGGFLGATGGGGGGGARWTDKSSLAMSHYEEAYRWLVELHQRAISWRAISMAVSSSGIGGVGGRNAPTYPSPAPKTPGEKTYTMDDIKSPTFSESPGGGIGVELSLPGSDVAPPPPSLIGATPPMRRDSPALTSKKGYVNAENIAFFASLWEQCRAVASIINVKLLRSTTTSSSSSSNGGDSNTFGLEAEEQWNRHRAIFLSNPQGVPGFQHHRNDDFFGPVWHRTLYITEELLTYACVAEGRWRRTLEMHSARSTVAEKNNTDATGATAMIALSPSYYLPGAPWRVYGELCEAVLGLRRVILLELKSGGRSIKWLPSSTAVSSRQKFVGSVALGSSGFGTMSWRFDNVSKRDHRAIALDYVLHALDLLDVHLSHCGKTTTERSLTSSPASEARHPMSSARLHYLAARLFMSIDDATQASVHLNIASSQTKSWPSLHISIQRAMLACADRHASSSRGADNPLSSSASSNPIDAKGTCIEILLHPGKYKLLSPKETVYIQEKAWKNDPASVLKGTSIREASWTQYDTTKTDTPFEFAVSFFESTHATSGDSVSACVSLKSHLRHPVIIESTQLITSSGVYEVPNMDLCSAEKSLHRSLQHRLSMTNDISVQGVSISPNDPQFFATELSLPSNLTDVLVGDTSSDTSRFTPKNCRLCNMGFTHAAGNICVTRLENKDEQNAIIDGKPVPISSLSKASSSLLGGIPWVCTGVVLTFKHNESDAPIKLQIQCPGLFSPLLRSGALKYIMEECNYTSHSWSRPVHHPLILGPRILRVLGPRPQMRVTNLTGPLTDCKLVKGTVNRIVFRLNAGEEEDCWDLRVKFKSTSSKKSLSIESTHDSSSTGGLVDDERNGWPIFVRKAADPTVTNVTDSGIALPVGWEPRKDIGSDDYNDITTSISQHLGAGKSLYISLDVFHPLDESLSSLDTCTTSYEAIFLYSQIRVGKRTNSSHDKGDQVMVVESGAYEWISPFSVEFSQMNGLLKPFPCGIQHASNAVSQTHPAPSSAVDTESISAEGERIQMRFSLGVNALGHQIAASILRVSNEKETNENQKELYPAGIGALANKLQQGSKLSLSYCVLAQKDIENGNGYDSIPLGVISVDWKPASISIPAGSTTMITTDEFGSFHGPLQLSSQPQMIFQGPKCQILDSPFMAKLLRCPATPKVGSPFCISYLVTNRSTKSQAVIVRLNDASAGDAISPPAAQLLGTGKLTEEIQLAPFEEKIFSFTFVSMLAGKVPRPSLSVSSSRHQTWVVNEDLLSPRYLFVMP